MKAPLLTAALVMLTLTACGTVRESRLNPFNWFGRSQETPVVAASTVPGVPADARPLVQQVTLMEVAPMQGGAIVRATGLPPTQGYWDGELVARPLDPEGNLVYDFRLVPPLGNEPVSTQQSREVQVAAFITAFQLQTIRSITVQAESNARSAGR